MAMVHDHTSRAGKMDMNTTVPTIDRPSDFSGKTRRTNVLLILYQWPSDPGGKTQENKYADCNITYG